jgi:hypothetical protein
MSFNGGTNGSELKHKDSSVCNQVCVFKCVCSSIKKSRILQIHGNLLRGENQTCLIKHLSDTYREPRIDVLKIEVCMACCHSLHHSQNRLSEHSALS